ncbi:ABC-type Fe3+-hydroxamate transport system periplasmic component-like protein [Methanocaldococcus lauensis]|nr:ABC-type Fe3+-hydroxamate transport system periplasmic component-like protein [Methanocaldococcus lauensis]
MIKKISILYYIIFAIILLSISLNIVHAIDYNHRLGDINRDGSVNIADVVYLSKHMNNISKYDGDLNADNNVNFTDVVYLFTHLKQLCLPIHYAQNLKIIYYDKYGNEVNPYNGETYSYKIVEDATGQRLLLKNESQPIPKWAEGKYDKVINVPLKRVVVMSSTHIALMEPLNDDGSVIASVKGIMWGGKYKWYFDNIKKGLENGSIIDVGSTYNPNWNLIINISPQVVFVYPGYDGDKIIEKCNKLNLTYVADAEYLENSYLARCEWVKMFAAFYNKEDVASKYFTRIEKNALNVKRVLSKSKNRPLVAWGRNYPSFGGTYVPKAQSYVAKGIEFCGGDYIFKDLPGTGSACIDYETFAERAKNADIWVVPSSTAWLSTFKEDHPGYKSFKAVKNGRLFCESDDYYQLGLINTDQVLEDLATIIHPELFKGRTTHYFLRYYPDNNTAEPYTAQ